MSKVPKKSIGLVNACTLYNPNNWSTLNGEQFCGIEKRQEPSKVLLATDKWVLLKLRLFKNKTSFNPLI